MNDELVFTHGFILKIYRYIRQIVNENETFIYRVNTVSTAVTSAGYSKPHFPSPKRYSMFSLIVSMNEINSFSSEIR